jgi:Sec-independent protein secretion pathway component TatC
MLIKLKLVAFLGLFLALPVVLYQLWAFIVPGLTKRRAKDGDPVRRAARSCCSRWGA